MPRVASSASSAKSCRYAKKADDRPIKSPLFVRALRAPIAAPFVAVGRMIEQGLGFLLRNAVGSGMIRFFLHVLAAACKVWKRHLHAGFGVRYVGQGGRV